MALELQLRTQLEVMADWALQHGVPAVIGEGYLGYTPLEARFEEGPSVRNCASSPCSGALSWVTGARLSRPSPPPIIRCGRTWVFRSTSMTGSWPAEAC